MAERFIRMRSRSILSTSRRSQHSANPGTPVSPIPDSGRGEEFQLERYKYILQQIHTVNENVYRFLSIYQALAVTLTSGALIIFVGYRRWGIPAPIARSGVIGLLLLLSSVALFTALLICIGVFSWLDYRREECELTDATVYPGFRKLPDTRNFLRWYETYIILFIIGSATLLWICTIIFVIPAIR